MLDIERNEFVVSRISRLALASQLSGFCEKRSAGESPREHFQIHDARALGRGCYKDLSF